jgi:hypothetical protein
MPDTLMIGIVSLSTTSLNSQELERELSHLDAVVSLPARDSAVSRRFQDNLTTFFRLNTTSPARLFVARERRC